MATSRKSEALPRPPSYQADMKGLLDLLARAPSAQRVALYVEALAGRWRETLPGDLAAERIEQLRADLGDGVEAAGEAMGEVDPGSKSDARNARAALEAVTEAKRSADGLGA